MRRPTSLKTNTLTYSEQTKHVRFNSQTLGLSPRAHAGDPFIRRARKFRYCFYSFEPPDGTKSPASDPVNTRCGESNPTTFQPQPFAMERRC